MTKLTKETLITDLQQFAAELEKTPTRNEMNDDGPHSSTPYYTQWGGWNDALEAAGLGTNHENGISEDKLVAELQRLDEESERLPRFEDMDEYGEYSGHTYLRTFGSWGEAKEAAGLSKERRTSRRIEREELVESMQELAEELGKAPTQVEMREEGRYSHRPYYREWDSWSGALRAAGYNDDHDMGTSKQALLEEIERLAEELGRSPTFDEMNEQGEYSVFPYLRTFGSWNDALNAAGYSVNKEHGVISGHLDYGPNWEKQRQKALERDEYDCQECGMANQKHLAEWDQGLHVHHITKRREFSEAEKANRLPNLLTLCQVCHWKIERLGD